MATERAAFLSLFFCHIPLFQVTMWQFKKLFGQRGPRSVKDGSACALTFHSLSPFSLSLIRSISSLTFILPNHRHSACCSSTPCWLKSTLKVYLSPGTVQQRCWTSSTWTTRHCFTLGALCNGGSLKDAVKLIGLRSCLLCFFFYCQLNVLCAS